jgi:hypothetical protein
MASTRRFYRRTRDGDVAGAVTDRRAAIFLARKQDFCP